jgi:hypothetical protein
LAGFIIEFTKRSQSNSKWFYLLRKTTVRVFLRSKPINYFYNLIHYFEIQPSPLRTMATMEDRVTRDNLFEFARWTSSPRVMLAKETDQLQLLQYDPAQMIEMNILVLSNRLSKRNPHHTTR